MKLPPLNALRAFECAARTGSFAAAGTEMGVTSAAISQQVRGLEDWLGRSLFTRRANRIRLTDAGQDYYMNAATALTDIASFTAQFADAPASRPLVISASPALAQLWAPSRLTRFAEAHPGVALHLREETDSPDMELSGIDLRLGYGEDHPDYQTQPLFTDAMVPVAAPGAGPLEDLRRIAVNWARSISTVPGWRQWEDSAGQTVRHPLPPVLASSVPVAMAEAGGGVALLPRQVTAPLLQVGRVIQMHDHAVAMGRPYVMVSAHYKSRWRRLQALISVLKS